MFSIQLDIRTILILFTLLRIAQAISMFHVWRTHYNYTPAAKWAFGSFLAALGVLLIGFRDLIPGLISIVGANLLAVSGWLIFDLGIIKAAGRRPPYRAGLITVIIEISAIFWFSMVEQNYGMRVIAFTVSTILFDGITAYACLKNPVNYSKATFRILGFSLIVIMISGMARVLYTYKFGMSTILSSNLPQAQYFIILLVFSVLITVMLVLLTTQNLQEEINVVNGELIRQGEIERDYARQNALTDGLTQISNRRHFDDPLSTEFFRLRRSGAPLSMVMLDIDHFKKFNDHHGHLAGDDSLKQVAAILKKVAGRAHDVVARYGGEEFAIILPEVEKHTAAYLAEKIRKSVEDLAIPHPDSDNSDVVTVSAGVVTVTASDIASPENVIALADEALYRAKEKGRNRVEVVETGSITLKRYTEIDHGFVQLHWNISNECGNEIIDHQHKSLFNISNQLFAAIIENHPKAACIKLMDQLMEEILSHFKDEENIFSAAGYPSAEEHRNSHLELVKNATDLIERYKSNELNPGELFSFLAYDVVAQHIFIEDRKYFPYLNS